MRKRNKIPVHMGSAKFRWEEGGREGVKKQKNLTGKSVGYHQSLLQTVQGPRTRFSIWSCAIPCIAKHGLELRSCDAAICTELELIAPYVLLTLKILGYNVAEDNISFLQARTGPETSSLLPEGAMHSTGGEKASINCLWTLQGTVPTSINNTNITVITICSLTVSEACFTRGTLFLVL